MISIQSNSQEFSRQLLAAIDRLDEELSFKFQSWTLRVFKDLVIHTPQWSGDTAANWNYSVNSPDGSYHPIIGKALHWGKEGWANRPEPLQRGDRAAVFAAVGRAQGGPMPRWTDKVFFTNNTPIADDLETHSVYVRPVNLVGGAVAMVSYTVAKWKNKPV